MSKSKIVRYKENPFLPNMIIKKKNKQLRISKVGKENKDNMLMNIDTGEVEYTHMVTYKEVDKSEFVKIFSQNIALTLNLSSAGLKALNLLIHAVQRYAVSKDMVPLGTVTLKEFNEANKTKISIQTLGRGLNELVANDIIARTEQRGIYFINPNFIFNGDRCAFTTAFKKKKSNKIDCNEQMSLE